MRPGDDVRRLKGRMAEIGVSQYRVAQAMGLSPSGFSQILSGARRMPDGFLDRAATTVERLAEAEDAADAARAAKLDEALAEAS